MAVATAVAWGWTAPRACAHGFAGQRFFPPTIQTDDPFAADELALPSIANFQTGDMPAARETDLGLSVSKLIFPRFALGFGETFTHLKAPDAGTVRGFQNLDLNAKYELWINGPHEAIVSIGADCEVGGTGAKQLGSDARSTFTPTFYFGKGFGDLPDSLTYLKPFAITGLIGGSVPGGAGLQSWDWGFALEYSLPYLQSFVKDVGLRAPLKNMIPLVELAFSTPVHAGDGPTTGTVNPGVLWEAPDYQLGVEVVIPANRASGRDVGVVVQVQIFIDDLWPHWFGHPVY